MNRLVKAVICLCVLCALGVSATAQSGKPYKKKTVSFVDNVVVPATVKLTTNQSDYIKKTVARNINFERFLYAPLPETVTTSFSNEVWNISRPTPEIIRPIMDRTLAPQLMKILDLNKELLSKQSLSEAERNTFLATKAQAAGLSAAQLEAILNSGFFYIPYVDSYRREIEHGFREVKNDKGKVIRRIPLTQYAHSVQLGLLWYKLNVDRNNKASVAFVGAAQGWNEESISRSDVHEDETSDGKKIDDDGTEDFNAFKAAVDVSCYNIQLETKKMEAFRLVGETTEASFFGVKLNLGSKEGVGLDDAYWVEEFEESATGDIVKNRRGFVKIREVGDNKKDENATSYAQTITGSNYSPGLTLTEIPMLGLNTLIGAGTFPASVSAILKTDNLMKENPNFFAKIRSESKTAYGASLSLQTDLANVTHISELWAQLGGAVGITSIDGTIYSSNGDSTDIGVSLTGYINFGIIKKFYFRRFGLLFQLDAKFAETHISVTDKDFNTYKLTNDNIGLDGRAGIEIYLSPVLSIGGSAEYNVFGVSNSWTAAVTDKDSKDTKNSSATGPDTKYSGVGVYLWINYSLPSLK